MLGGGGLTVCELGMVELPFGGFVLSKGPCGNAFIGGAVRSIRSVFFSVGGCFLLLSWFVLSWMLRECLTAWRTLSHANAKGKGINSEG